MKNKTLGIILSVAGACLLWLYVITAVDPVITTTISGIPVQILGADSLGSQGQTLDSVSHKSVSVTVTGSRSDSALITAADIIATIDVSGQPNGENDVRVNVSVPSNVELKEVKPNRITAYVEDFVTEEKEYDVNYIGTLPAGYELGFLSFSPETVTVSGSRSRVEKVKTVHVDFDLSKLTKDGYAFELPVTPMSAALTEVEYVNLSSQTVQGKAYLCETKEIPLVVETEGEIPEGYELLVEGQTTIKVRSALYDLAELNEVPTMAVAVPELGETADVVLTPLLPQDVEPADSYSEPHVTVSLQEISEENSEEGEESAGDSGEEAGESNEGRAR